MTFKFNLFSALFYKIKPRIETNKAYKNVAINYSKMKILQHQKNNNSSNSNSPIKNSPKKRQQVTIQSTLPIKRPKISLVDESPTKQQLAPPKLPWVEKYKPTNLKQLIGQQTDKCPTNKLLDWLKKWAANHLTAPMPGEKKKARPNPFAAQSDGSAFKVALLSGPPGIGKTTAAVMCCKELGLAFVEMNASDARNKLSIEKHSEQITSNQIEKYCKPKTTNGHKTNGNSLGVLMPTNKQNVKKSPPKKGTSSAPNVPAKQIEHVLIMDEVDGMSGNADRAGIAELIQMIKRTKVPIICICNDRQSRKIRSLSNYCFDLRFQRPRADQIKGRLLTIMARENVQIPKEALDRIIEASNQDIRNCINTLQLMAGGTSNKDLQKKDITVNIFEAARQILNVDTPFLGRAELYFTDYSLMPLFVQENYPNVRGSRMSNLDHLRAIQQASDSIAFSDIVSRQIRSNNHWGLLNEHAMFSCALPATFMDGYMAGQIQFPAWFGKNSNAQKRQRLMRQLGMHTHLKITGSNQALVQDYLPLLRERLYRPLIKNDAAGVKDVLPVYKHYCLLKEDTEAINELGVWPAIGGKRGGGDLASMVSTKAKSALTRQLNKEKRLLPFAQPGQVKISRKGEKTAAMKKNNKIGGKDDDEEDGKEGEAGSDEDMEMDDDDEQEEMMLKMEY